ncbi:Glu/Leu/Phe/Val dehydrogenase [Rhodobacter sp. 24-YEA-8]|uniref:Glu/Leu/Phe/Val family dehydrogenase n=1 Tax=Rhodobacter sp. 24-YEA-8 TaxID=1884310 RepID=UPI0008971ED3|nr:Glu/Leu/Phe/Val dehydrogenase dimerization domain-containing protein [Rhodobacter sp. 24-YEA-8]SED63957.1 leucine dehydrogenase [Rhodobacter sp. 24-YEA-8]
MACFDHPEFDDHESIVFCADARTGLRAIIAIHDTTLGPALGGCRVRAYESDAAALRDVLRLSRGMSYKNALAGLPLGGGKAVLIADPQNGKTPERLASFGDQVDRLGGAYITAEDSNSTPADMEIIATRTAHVRNLGFGAGDSPSPVTALGTWLGIQSGLEFAGVPLSDAVISVEGLGAVGMDLLHHLAEGGARLVVSDIDKAKTEEACRRFGASTVPAGTGHMVEAAVFAPCAMGAGLNARTIPQIRARVIAGAANNQLETPADGQRLKDQGIIYCPDYVVNAGGVLGIPLQGETVGMEERKRRAAIIRGTTLEVLERAARENIAPHIAADRMAQEIILNARR